ncbi:MAG TPA: FG-GAP-like repeat-containing protein [Planctomycetota bacterium]|nr:FG-GAP-like repeat-containing protein [Planctomycetota bacterium]HRR82177.1 FG-GAP-like repeat-containing protein [Planctomycetota bacterium]HRT93883.1 FG-GAP-like repeat-containing protein [Planctomycetota bacterium]
MPDHPGCWTHLAAILCFCAALAACRNTASGAAAATARAPEWNARGTGPLPRQGIACLDVSDDGRFVAVGTIAAPGEPNLFVLDEGGKIVQQHRAGLRWLNEVSVSNDGAFVAALCTTPEGTAGDSPRLYAFLRGKELSQVSAGFRLRDFRPGGFLFHYGDHSNHLPRVAQRAGDEWVVAGDDRLWWLSPAEATAEVAHLGAGVTASFAASASGRAVVGRFLGVGEQAAKLPNLLVLERGQAKPAWTRPVSIDVAPSPQPEKGAYGPPAPPYENRKFSVPLAVAIDREGEQVAVADYEGWQRVFRPSDGSAEFPSVPRIMSSRPTIHVYDADGKVVCRIGPESFKEPLWCDLAFSPDGKQLLISPHMWPSRGLGGRPLLPADEGTTAAYILDIAKAAVRPTACPDASSIVRASADGKRLAVATTAGAVEMRDADGRQLWQTDLNDAVPLGDKPWTRNQQPGKIAPGIWRTNGGFAHSDMGTQLVIEAPDGLIMIDPNAAASFEQNWAKIQGAGLDPMKVKYVLLTHEHGDHAPGAYLWRVVTGAQVVASAEMAYILQHHLPNETGYGFHPPNPVDIALTEDKELDLAGLKVKAIRLPGHTYGSMGYVFTKDGKTYVATGDLIMPGGVLGYSGSFDFSAENVLASLRKLTAIKPDEVLGGHGGGPPDNFIAAGILAGEATGWSRMKPEKPNPLFGFKQTNYLVAAWLQRILSAACGDIDGDGRPDVAVLVPSGRGSAVLIYLNKGGKFAEAPDAVVDLPDLSHGWKLRVVRVSGGKGADLFASSEGQAFLLIPEQGQLKFRTVPLPGLTRASQVLTGDFNGDGRTDLLIGGRFIGGYSIAYQGENGTFRFRSFKAPERGYFGVALADVNGDQRDDLIFSTGDIFLRRPDGSFEETPSIHLNPPTGSGEQAGWVFLAAADFDKDGWTDVALLVSGKEGTIVSLYRNTKDPKQPFAEKPSAEFVAKGCDIIRDGPTAADWNGDGVPDLILATREKPSARVLLGSAADGLDPERAVTVPLDYTPHFDTQFSVADFNGDGKADLASFGPSAAQAVGVYIWLQP